MNLADTYRTLYSMLDRRERRRALVVGMIMVAVSISEVLGVASVLPFLSAVADPTGFASNPIVVSVGLDRMSGHPYFLAWLGTGFLVVLVLSLVLRGLGAWALLRFASNRNVAWSVRLLRWHLSMPYQRYLSCNASDLTASVISEVDSAVTDGLMPSLQIVSQFLVSLLIVTMLVIANPLLAVSVAALMCGGFWIVSAMLRPRLHQLGTERVEIYNLRLRLVQEFFVGFKELRLGRLESAMLETFAQPSVRRAQLQVQAGVFSQIPALAMQAVLFGGLLGVAVALLVSVGSIGSVLPLLGLYAFAAYRLMPALQRLFEELAKLRTASFAIQRLSKALRDVIESERAEGHSSPAVDPEPNGTFGSLALHDVAFTYPGKTRAALTGVSVSVAAGEFVGIVGSTGSGKSTLLDLALGLLEPTHGQVTVNGESLSSSLAVRKWHRRVGYVPQQIFLTDATIVENIAFGVPASLVDMARVREAAQFACIAHYIESVPDGYGAGVGDRGMRISGGQRQRLGIARALYHRPQVLVMDEATSALDSATEAEVMRSVRFSAIDRTVIVIAHRLSTVRECDKIIVVAGGTIQAVGTYEELERGNPHFQALLGHPGLE